MNTEKNQELTKLIGRRLREACGRDVGNDLPIAISGRLTALKEAEAQRHADDLDRLTVRDATALKPPVADARPHDKGRRLP